MTQKQEDLESAEPYKVVGKGTKWEKRLSKEQYDRRLKRQKEYVKENKEEVYLRQQKHREDNHLKYLLISVKSRAKQHEREFNLDLSWIEMHYMLAGGVCSKTGVPYSTDHVDSDGKPSIDRIDNEKGYTKDNCQLVCWAYNRAKSSMTDVQLLELARRIVATADSKNPRIFNEDLIDE